MAQVKNIATRDSYGATLQQLAAEHPELVVLDADLSAATRTSMFQKVAPERFFDCGIAEANMIGVAAGLATMGLVPFVSSFAMFAAARAYEQILNSIAYPRLNVKIGASHGGISVGEDGASHQCCEDFALMRSLPGMTVICPSDDVEARAADAVHNILYRRGRDDYRLHLDVEAHRVHSERVVYPDVAVERILDRDSVQYRLVCGDDDVCLRRVYDALDVEAHYGARRASERDHALRADARHLSAAEGDSDLADVLPDHVLRVTDCLAH